jgi:8-oxo-dGTP pyrophosphatase MutT (NUDIX family)
MAAAEPTASTVASTGSSTARRPITRPPVSRLGSPAPWAGLPVTERTGITLDRVVAALDARTPPTPERLAEPWRHLALTELEGSPAAVLVALFDEDGETRVVLTVRSNHLRSHTGEVAFPGGRLEPGEEVVDAALREAREEVGLDPALVRVVGQLSPMPTIASTSVMTPVVASLTERPSLIASPTEVERVFDVALAELVAEGVFHEEWWSASKTAIARGFPDGEFPVWFFEVAGETVWGATARTLVELVCLVLGVRVPSSLRSQ